MIEISPEEIRRSYWPEWYEQQCQRWEQAYVDEYLSFEDCLADWYRDPLREIYSPYMTINS